MTDTNKIVSIGRYGWKNALTDRPPRNGHGLVVLVQITCECGRGGQVALSAGRMNGEWVIGGDFRHSFEIDYWTRLPDFPPVLPRAEEAP